jgi:UDP-glucose 4-epimerase
MAHFAIVGGAGFIGSHFVDFLALDGHHITVIDNFSSGTRNHINQHSGKQYLQVIETDAENTDLLTAIFANVDTVIHLASNPDIALAATQPRIDFLKGTVLTESVLEASRRAGVKSFLYASGSGVYSEDGLNAISENHKLQPISTYGASKLAGETLLSSYSYMFGMKGISFRFANVVGPKQTHGVGFDFLNKLKSDPSVLKILGDGTQTKSYIDVSDVVRGVLTAHTKLEYGYEVYNVSTEDLITVSEIAKIAVEVLGLNSEKVRIEFGNSDRGWKGDVPKIRLDSSKLRALGWCNRLTSRKAIEQSLQSMVSSVRR